MNAVCVLKVVAISLTLSTSAFAMNTYHWPDEPLEVIVQVGQERAISIPEADALHLGIPQRLTTKLSAEIIGNRLWLNAIEPFSSTRVVLIAEPVGRLIFVVRTGNGVIPTGPIVIRSKPTPQEPQTKQSSSSHGYVKLTRWAIQQLYAPQRLRSELPGVQQISLESNAVEIFRCGSGRPVACAGAIAATPVAGWQTEHFFVTAIKLTNKLSQQIILDPRDLLGKWRTAAFVHNQLHATGYPGDTTVLIVVSDFPFTSAFR